MGLDIEKSTSIPVQLGQRWRVINDALENAANALEYGKELLDIIVQCDEFEAVPLAGPGLKTACILIKKIPMGVSFRRTYCWVFVCHARHFLIIFSATDIYYNGLHFSNGTYERHLLSGCLF